MIGTSKRKKPCALSPHPMRKFPDDRQINPEIIKNGILISLHGIEKRN